MARVIALVEGPTEEKFVRELLAGELGVVGVWIVATTYGRPRRQAGVPAWSKAEREIIGLLKQDTARYVTTMFDYYGMPRDWPGRKRATERPHGEKAALVEQGMRDSVTASSRVGSLNGRFIPYVQMHEFEALLFSDPQALADVVSRAPNPHEIRQNFVRIAGAFPTPEQIDDDPVTAPSKRILALARDYQKVTDGNIAASRIGLETMRRECPHFKSWLQRLRALSQKSVIGERVT